MRLRLLCNDEPKIIVLGCRCMFISCFILSQKPVYTVSIWVCKCLDVFYFRVDVMKDVWNREERRRNIFVIECCEFDVILYLLFAAFFS